MSSIDDIEEFLCKVRVLIANNKFRFLKKRKKNMISLALLGLTPEDIPEIIAELRYENYSSGPEDDRDREDKNCIWVFEYQYEEYEIYIKLKITTEELSNSITTSSVEETEIIQITVENAKAKDAQKITDEVAKVFAKEIKDIYNLENVTIIDKAELAKSPYNVNYVKDNIIYLVIGIVLSFGVVFVMYYFDTSIKSSEVVEEKLGLTVIGIVPKEERK